MIGHANNQYKREIQTLGIDASLVGTGLCFLDNGVLLPHFMPEKKLRGAERLTALRDRLQAYISGLPSLPQIAVIEGYSYDSTNRLADLAEWGGLIRVVLYEHGIPYVTPTPTQLKLFAAGNGGADKDKVMEWVEKKWGLNVDGNDNLSDAAALAKIGYVYLTGDSTYRSELEVVKDMKTPKEKNGKYYKKLRGVL